MIELQQSAMKFDNTRTNKEEHLLGNVVILGKTTDNRL